MEEKPSTWYSISRIVLYGTFAMALYVFYTVAYLDPCERVQTYSIGEIYPKSAIEDWRLEELLWSVEDMWEDAAGLSLFRYVEQDGDIRINIFKKSEIANTQPGESFEKGSHYKGEINIYHFENEQDLIMVLAHEFGHALDLGHVVGDESIMVANFQNHTLFPLQLTEYDRVELRTQCRKMR